jgi:hypothetical protein
VIDCSNTCVCKSAVSSPQRRFYPPTHLIPTYLKSAAQEHGDYVTMTFQMAMMVHDIAPHFHTSMSLQNNIFIVSIVGCIGLTSDSDPHPSHDSTLWLSTDHRVLYSSQRFYYTALNAVPSCRPHDGAWSKIDKATELPLTKAGVCVSM